MTLEELLAALEQQENGAEMVGVVKSLAGEITKKNNEAANLRKRAKTAEDSITALNDNFSKVATFIGLDLEDENTDLDTALEAYKQKQAQIQDPNGGKGQPSPEVAKLTSDLAQLQRDMKKLSTEKETFAQTAAQEKAKRIELLRDAALQKELANGKAVKPDLLAKILQSNIKLVEDGSDSFVFIADDGSEVTVQEGVKSFLDTNPDFVINSGRPGSGSGGAGGKEITLDNLSPEEYRAVRAKQ